MEISLSGTMPITKQAQEGLKHNVNLESEIVNCEYNKELY